MAWNPADYDDRAIGPMGLHDAYLLRSDPIPNNLNRATLERWIRSPRTYRV